MKRLLFSLLLIVCGAQNSEARPQWNGDSLFRGVIKKSECIVSATIVEIGRKVRMEDGVVEFDMRCVVYESFKGKLKTGDTISVHILEFTLSLGGKYMEGDEGSSLYEEGNTLVFFLQDGTGSNVTHDPQFEPVDVMLGVMQRSEQLTYYLRMYVQAR